MYVYVRKQESKRTYANRDQNRIRNRLKYRKKMATAKQDLDIPVMSSFAGLKYDKVSIMFPLTI